MPSGNGIRIQYEENPRNELTPAGTPGTGPNRVSTVSRDFPTTAARLNANPTLLDRSAEARNIPAAVPGLQDSFAPDGALAERAYIDDLIFLFGLAGYTGVFTAGNGVITDPDAGTIPTGASRWQFTRRTGITPQTAQMTALYANEGMFLQGRGYAISDWTINAIGEFGSTWAGLFVGAIADPSIVPVLISPAIPPVRRADLSLTWVTGGAKASDFSLSDTTGLQVSYDMGSNGSYFPETIEFADALPRMTGSVTKRQINSNDWAALIAASTFSAKAKWLQTVNIGATTYKYTMWIEMPSCYLTGGTPDDISANRRRGASYNFEAGYDAAAGYDVRITCVGSITAVSTYA